jgi:hypothetical protein
MTQIFEHYRNPPVFRAQGFIFVYLLDRLFEKSANGVLKSNHLTAMIRKTIRKRVMENNNIGKVFYFNFPFPYFR